MRVYKNVGTYIFKFRRFISNMLDTLVRQEIWKFVSSSVPWLVVAIIPLSENKRKIMTAMLHEMHSTRILIDSNTGF